MSRPNRPNSSNIHPGGRWRAGKMASIDEDQIQHSNVNASDTAGMAASGAQGKKKRPMTAAGVGAKR